MTELRRKTLLALAATAALAACQQGGEAGNQAGNGGGTQGSASASGGNAKAAAGGTIADAMSKSGDHSALVQALRSAGLDKTLAGAGPYTVFAPTNAAFQKLPPGVAEGWTRPDGKGVLIDVLTYHVVSGAVTAKDLADAIKRGGGKTQIATVGGGTLTVTQADGGIVVSDGRGGQARVTQADMMQSNGVVHSLDAVLMPQES